MPSNSGFTVDPAAARLLDYPFTTVRLACDKCDRQERFSKDKLVAAHGADIVMLELRPLILQCDRRHGPGRSCGVFFPDLIQG